MQMSSVTENSTAKSVEVQKQAISDSLLGVEIGLLTGCQDRPYAFGLAMALVSMQVGDEINNRTPRRVQYRLCDRICVEPPKMKDELCQECGVSEKAVTMIRHQISNAIRDTALTPS